MLQCEIYIHRIYFSFDSLSKNLNTQKSNNEKAFNLIKI